MKSPYARDVSGDGTPDGTASGAAGTLHATEMANVWVVRGGERDELVRPFLDDGEIGVGFPEFPDGGTVDRTAVLRIMGVGMDDEPSKQQEARAATFLSFVRRVQIGDLVLLVDRVAKGFAVGVASGDYRYRSDLDERRARHRRPVQWRRRLPFADLPERLAKVPDQKAAFDEVPDGRLRDLALQCSRGERGDDPFDRPARAAPARRASGGARPRSSGASTRRKTVTKAERRCTTCLVTKPLDLFDGDGDMCVDCA